MFSKGNSRLSLALACASFVATAHLSLPSVVLAQDKPKPAPDEPAKPAPKEPAKPAPKEPAKPTPNEPAKPATDDPGKAYLITKAKSKEKLLSTFVKVLEEAGLVDSLVSDEPFTVFMPVNAAFKKMENPNIDLLIRNREREKLKDLVHQHMVKGALTSDKLLGMATLRMENGRTLQVSVHQEAFTIGGAAIIESDIICKNGVIHLMEGVIQGETRPVMQMAKKDGRFWKFLDAAKASGIAPMLSSKGDFTVFAPTDAAFKAVSEKDMKYLSDPRNRSVLLELMRRHIVRGQVFAMDLKKKSEVRAMAGNVIPITFAKARFEIGGGQVVIKDIVAANGVIHGIDKVLLPELPADGKPRPAKAMAAALIGQSVQNAVPLFNSGQVDAVAALFQQTADSILQLGRGDMPKEAIKAIEDSIAAAAKSEDGHDKSWELRKGLDKAFDVLTQ